MVAEWRDLYSASRSKRLAGVLVAVAAFTGATVAHREPARCECASARESPVYALPEVQVVAKRLPG
jgi:hypothetical protein